MKRKPKQRRSFTLKILILGLCVYMIITNVSLLSKLVKDEEERDATLALLRQTEQDVEEYKALLADESNKQIIEKAARERLGYIYSDEQIFIDISGS